MSEGHPYLDDPVFGDRTIVAPGRSGRPNEYRNGPEERCPFCPGNESETPPESARVAGPDGWLARSFPNKYAIVAEPDGVHEVIVDSPHHAAEFSRAGMQLWRDGYRALSQRRIPVLFKNTGTYGGATLRHPHSQIVALNDVPPRFRALLDRSSYLPCPVCDEADDAASHGRLVHRAGSIVAYVPEADRFGYVLNVAPVQCLSDFGALDDAALGELASFLARVPASLPADGEGRRPSFNVLLYALPPDLGASHWRMQFVERAGSIAGFELASGLYVRSASAQESAERWRQLLASSC